MSNLNQIAQAMVAEGKGILAADESSSTADKRFLAVGIDQTEEQRRLYRQLLVTAPDLNRYISGVILYDETLRQSIDSGQTFPVYLESIGVIPGIKVDLGLKDIPNFPEEKISQGLDNLADRLKEYYQLGARFTKWRSVIVIGEDTPTDLAISANAQVLARYAAIVQQANMVPMVEPEVLFDGTHTLARSQQVLKQVLHELFVQLRRFKVDLSGVILKTSMALPGKDSGETIIASEVAAATGSALIDCVPAETAGVVFLSGGQTPHDAFLNLNAIAQNGPYPWGLTFSYARALQDPVLKHWVGDKSRVVSAQEIFIGQLKKAAAARAGDYAEAGEDEFVSSSQDL